MPSAVSATDGRAPPDDPGRDGRGPHSDLRLREHDRGRAGSMTIAFTPEQLAEVRRLQGLYPDKRGALLPVLHMAQDTFGYISLEAEAYVAGLFGLSPAHVHEVATFYTLYFKEPKGRHVVAVCHNLSCHLAGAQDLLRHLESRLGIQR